MTEQIILTETIPDDMPEWMIKAMAEEQLFKKVIERDKAMFKCLTEAMRLLEDGFDYLDADNDYEKTTELIKEYDVLYNKVLGLAKE